MTTENCSLRVMLKEGRHNCFLKLESQDYLNGIHYNREKTNFPFLFPGFKFFARIDIIFVKSSELLILDKCIEVLFMKRKQRKIIIYVERRGSFQGVVSNSSYKVDYIKKEHLTSKNLLHGN